MTVETAVAIAGGFGPRGFRKTMIISRNLPGGHGALRSAEHLPDPSRRYGRRPGTLVLTGAPNKWLGNPAIRTSIDFYFTFFARNAIERCQASLAAASL